jgi:outer membrane protein OmpA-like peptidoglycan-associated protein
MAASSVARSYMVFFDFNKSDLTAQAVSIVDQAAAHAGPAKATQLVVTGHTDTVGSDAYNLRLSRRRAESVAAELEKKGIPSSEIEIVAKGKKDLLVPTAASRSSTKAARPPNPLFSGYEAAALL